LNSDKEDGSWDGNEDVDEDTGAEDGDAGARGDVLIGNFDELGDELEGDGPDEDGGDGLFGLGPGGLAVAGPPAGGFGCGDHDTICVLVNALISF